MAHQSRVLSLYRKTFRIASRWQANNQSDTVQERDFIRDEARRLFRRNKNVSDETEIKQHIQEAEARIDLALHYNIPYPRAVNMPTYSLPNLPMKKRLKSQQRVQEQTKPIYFKSYSADKPKDS